MFFLCISLMSISYIEKKKHKKKQNRTQRILKCCSVVRLLWHDPSKNEHLLTIWSTILKSYEGLKENVWCVNCCHCQGKKFHHLAEVITMELSEKRTACKHFKSSFKARERPHRYQRCFTVHSLRAWIPAGYNLASHEKAHYFHLLLAKQHSKLLGFLEYVSYNF